MESSIYVLTVCVSAGWRQPWLQRRWRSLSRKLGQSWWWKFLQQQPSKPLFEQKQIFHAARRGTLAAREQRRWPRRRADHNNKSSLCFTVISIWEISHFIPFTAHISSEMLDYSLCYRIVLTLCGPNKRPVWHYNDELIVCGILFWIRLLENAWKSIMLKVGFLKIDFVEHCYLIDRIWGTDTNYSYWNYYYS